MEVKPTYLGTMLSLATIAFGLIAASAWNKFIADAIALFLRPGAGIAAEFVYALLVTLLAIFVVRGLARIAAREFGPRTGPPDR